MLVFSQQSCIQAANWMNNRPTNLMRASLYLPMNNLAFNQLKLITTKCISLCQAEAGAVCVCIPLAVKGVSFFLQMQSL